MILTVDELKKHIETDEDDIVLESKLAALELMIRAHTNNNFQKRNIRRMADIAFGTMVMTDNPFKVGDTVQVTESYFSDDIYTVIAADENTITVKEGTVDEDNVLLTKVVYPMDIRMGVVNLMKWELERRDKVGVSSETISRHSVTYESMTDSNTIMGYPKALMGFLAPYMKARFGQGVGRA